MILVEKRIPSLSDCSFPEELFMKGKKEGFPLTRKISKFECVQLR
jgi:hypothetical protein